MGDWRDKYTKKSGDFAPMWAPDEGDSCEGIVTESGDIKGQYGTYTCYTVACTEDGAFTGERLAIHANTKILRDELEDVEPGDLIGLTYKGKRPNKSTEGSHKVHQVAHMPASEVVEQFPDLAGEPPAPKSSEDEEPF